MGVLWFGHGACYAPLLAPGLITVSVASFCLGLLSGGLTAGPVGRAWRG
jgi:hypothetical protein